MARIPQVRNHDKNQNHTAKWCHLKIESCQHEDGSLQSCFVSGRSGDYFALIMFS